jgi:hypothetical protein
MKTKPADASSSAVPPTSAQLPGEPAAAVVDERLEKIGALWQRSSGYVQFICAVGHLGGTSVELKEKALEALYARLVIIERQLSRIQDDLRLG